MLPCFRPIATVHLIFSFSCELWPRIVAFPFPFHLFLYIVLVIEKFVEQIAHSAKSFGELKKGLLFFFLRPSVLICFVIRMRMNRGRRYGADSGY